MRNKFGNQTGQCDRNKQYVIVNDSADQKYRGKGGMDTSAKNRRHSYDHEIEGYKIQMKKVVEKAKLKVEDAEALPAHAPQHVPGRVP